MTCAVAGQPSAKRGGNAALIDDLYFKFNCLAASNGRRQARAQRRADPRFGINRHHDLCVAGRWGSVMMRMVLGMRCHADQREQNNRLPHAASLSAMI